MKTKAFIYIVIAGILWGTAGLFVHYLTPFGFSSLQLTAIRGSVAAMAMTVYLFFFNRQAFKVTLKDVLLFACSGFFLFGTSSCYYIAMQASSVSTAVILMYTSPVVVMAFSVAFFNEKMTTLKTLSVVCMLAGCCLVSGIVGGMEFNFMGVIMGLAASFSYSAYNVFTKIQMRRFCNPKSATLFCLIFMALVALSFSNPPEIVSIIAQKPSAILPLSIGLGICTCVLPYFLYTMALKDLPVGIAASLGIVEPMSATLFSVLLLGEPLSFPTLCGIILILIAVLILSRSKD
ncbi:MAG: EamA family transporter [Clostridia bacterium]|nr:EamA family transporter [Clostridia bacterium]